MVPGKAIVIWGHQMPRPKLLFSRDGEGNRGIYREIESPIVKMESDVLIWFSTGRRGTVGGLDLLTSLCQAKITLDVGSLCGGSDLSKVLGTEAYLSYRVSGGSNASRILYSSVRRSYLIINQLITRAGPLIPPIMITEPGSTFRPLMVMDSVVNLLAENNRPRPDSQWKLLDLETKEVIVVNSAAMREISLTHNIYIEKIAGISPYWASIGDAEINRID